MNKYDSAVNSMLTRILEQQGCGNPVIVKIKTAAGDIVDIKATDCGGSIIAAETVEDVQSGTDITDRVCDSTAEEDAEEDSDLKGLGIDDDAIAAVKVAGKLASKSGGFGTAAFTQNRMNAAYGDLMRKIAGRVSKIASNIK